MKQINGIILIVALATALLVGYQVVASYQRDAAELVLLKDEVAALKSQVNINGAKLDGLTKNEQDERIESKKYHDDVVQHVQNIKITIPAQVANMPQTEAIAKTQELIGDTGVTDNNGGALFTPKAFRLNLEKLVQGVEFSLALEDSEAALASANTSLAIKDQKEILYQDTIKKQNEIIVLKDNEIKIVKKSNAKGKVTAGAVGVALGIILTLLIHK